MIHEIKEKRMFAQKHSPRPDLPLFEDKKMAKDYSKKFGIIGVPVSYDFDEQTLQEWIDDGCEIICSDSKL